MILFAYVNENIVRIKREIRIGLIPCSLLKHWEIYGRYDALKKMNYKTSDAVFCISENIRLSERSVFLIIKKMEAEI